jgi:hypothetical protein
MDENGIDDNGEPEGNDEDEEEEEEEKSDDDDGLLKKVIAIIDKGNEDEEGMNTDDNDDDDDEKSAELLEHAEVDWDYWSEVFEDAISNLSTKPQNAEQLIQKTFIDDFLDNLRETLEHKIHLANYLQHTDPIYLEIKRNAEKLQKMEPHIESAFEKAWEQRHYLLKRFIRQNLDTIQHRCFDDHCGGGDDAQDVDDDDDDEQYGVQDTFLKKYRKLYL